MDGIDFQELRELLEFLKANEIAEFKLEKGDLKVGVKFAGSSVSATSLEVERMAQMLSGSHPGSHLGSHQGSHPGMNFGAQPGTGVPAAVANVHSAGEATPDTAAAVETLHTVKSPIVGTFYDAPSPNSPVFVKVGDTVEVGQVLCIVEAMKLMNEIESDAAGEIVGRIANAGQPVEYGQSLFTIRAR